MKVLILLLALTTSSFAHVTELTGSSELFQEENKQEELEDLADLNQDYLNGASHGADKGREPASKKEVEAESHVTEITGSF